MRLRKKPWIEEAMKDVMNEYVFMHDIEKFKGHWQELFPGKDKKLDNVRIICANAENLLDWFEPGEIKELYLNFSDPWPKARHAKRRLTHRGFLAKYKELLGEGGHLRFKTDNRALFDFSVEEFKEFGLNIIALSYDLHHSEYDNPVQTEYEQKFSALGTPINFCEVVF